MSDGDRLELVDASGPVSPKHQHATKIVITEGRATRRHRDAGGEVRDERDVGDGEWKALVDAVIAVVPLGTTLDLVGDKRRNKGVAKNRVVLVVGGKEARIDYLPSHLDEEDGDARVREVVERIRASFA